jgi:hypothetical protein
VSVHVSARDLKNSFVRLSNDGGRLAGPGSHLLRFYAVECGLKAALLRRIDGEATTDLPAKLTSGTHGHDLHRLAQELRVNETAYSGITHCRRRAPSTQTVDATAVHQARRYGARLNINDENRFVACLNNLTQWCRKELRNEHR